MRTLVFLVAIIISGSMLASLAPAQDWPRYRHDGQLSAIADEELKPPLANVWMLRSRLSWRAPTEQASTGQRNTPAGRYADKHTYVLSLMPDQCRHALAITAVGDAVYYTGHDGRVVCVDAASGAQRWEYLTPAAISCTANYYEGKLYVGSDDGCVYCLNATTGALVWKFNAAPTARQFISYGRVNSMWPVRSDVNVRDGIAYFSAGVFPHDGLYVYAVDAETGEQIWQSREDSFGIAGNSFITDLEVYFPVEAKGFGTRAWAPLFRRSDGVFDWTLQDPETQGRNPAEIEFGVEYEGTRYLGEMAYRTNPETNAREDVWNFWGQSPGRFPDVKSVVLSGGVVYYLANDSAMWGNDYPLRAYGGAVYARDAATGEELWSYEFPERPYHLAIAQGRLLVSTRSGTIYCFAPEGAAAHGIVTTPLEPEPLPKDGIYGVMAGAAQHDVMLSGASSGFAVVLDCESGALPYHLAARSDFYVCAVFADEQQAEAARQAYSKAELLASRIAVYHVPPGEPLPFPTNFADVVVSEAVSAGGDLPGELGETYRVLKPIRGVALFGSNQQTEEVAEWVTARNEIAGEAPAWEYLAEHAGHWAKWIKPAVPDSGGWAGPLGGPGRTNCSHDAALQGPLGVVWYGPPFIQGYTGRPPLVVEGVMVCPIDGSTVEAYDQYNGTLLWRQTGLGGSVSANGCAGGGMLYVIDGGHCRRFDLYRGYEQSEFSTPWTGGQWTALAVSRDGSTIWGTATAGVTSPEEENWRGMFALEAASGRTLWTSGGPAGSGPSDWRAIADGRMYVVGGEVSDAQRDAALAEMGAYLRENKPARLVEFEKTIEDRQIQLITALDAQTGELLWERAVDVTGTMGWCAAAGDTLVYGGGGSSGKNWAGWPGSMGMMAAHDGATGELLWSIRDDFRFQPVVTTTAIYAEPRGYDLRSGERLQRPHPLSGEPSEFVWVRAGKHCGGYTGSENFIFGRNMFVGYYDTQRDNGLYSFMHSRIACNSDVATGGGMMIKPPMSIGCTCTWSQPFTIALAPVENEPEATFMYFHPGEALPIDEVRLNFGEIGDLRDKAGNLWLRPERPTTGYIRALLCDWQPRLVGYEGMNSFWRDMNRSTVHTPIANTETPFVFTSYSRGLREVVLPLTTPADGAATYRVRLGFAAPPGDEPGSRVFDVTLNGETVLTDFDIAAEAGGTDIAIWREFTVTTESDLSLGFSTKVADPELEQMPLLCGLEVLREQVDTLGYTAPLDTWLNEREPAKTIELQLANLTDEAFNGQIVFENPQGGLRVSQVDPQPLNLAPGQRLSVPVTLEAGENTALERYEIAMRVESAEGETVLERVVPVDYIGPLERKVLGGSSFCVRTQPLGEALRWITPNATADQLLAAGSAEGVEQLAARSYLWFAIPQEVRGNVRSARVRLQTPVGMAAATRALLPGGESTGAGQVRLVAGPPWPNFNGLTYAELPATEGEARPLTPLAGSNLLREAIVPVEPGSLGEPDTLFLAIEPNGEAPAIYWSTQTVQLEKRPVLVLDYMPAEPAEGTAAP